jgi:SnoaL-like domain
MPTNETPDVITRYLKLAPEGDLDTLVTCFTSNAEVIDEGKTYRGHDEIRGWREAVAAAFTYTMAVLDTAMQGEDRYIVTAKLEGSFPGSPVELKFRFTLADGLISALQIAP